jgi:hypothetical protein
MKFFFEYLLQFLVECFVLLSVLLERKVVFVVELSDFEYVFIILLRVCLYLLIVKQLVMVDVVVVLLALFLER